MIGLVAVAAVIIVVIASREVPAARRARAPAPASVEQPTPAGHARSCRSRAAPRTTTTRSATTRSTPRRLARVVDRDDGTAWSTESYQAGLEGAGKTGVGIYIDAKPKVDAVSMQIETPEPGLKATIYAAPPGSVAQVRPRGLDQGRRRHRQRSKDKRFKLDTGGTAYRYYLVWITEAGRGDADSAEISEIRLFQEVAA